MGDPPSARVCLCSFVFVFVSVSVSPRPWRSRLDLAAMNRDRGFSCGVPLSYARSCLKIPVTIRATWDIWDVGVKKGKNKNNIRKRGGEVSGEVRWLGWVRRPTRPLLCACCFVVVGRCWRFTAQIGKCLSWWRVEHKHIRLRVSILSSVLCA